jgi:hypothetical protein
MSKKKVETDGLGNKYRLVCTLKGTSWYDIKKKAKELFDINYGNYDGQVLAVTSSHELNGDRIHNFNQKNTKFFVDQHIIKVLNKQDKTEFWEQFGKATNIFEHERDQKKRREIIAKLVKGVSTEDLEKASLKIKK